MFFRKILLLFVFLAILVISYLALGNKDGVTQLIINEHKISVEIADSNSKRSKGLSGRQNLDANHGMLFVFNDTGYHNFWMYDMRYPLDFVWIKDDKVVDVTEKVANPSAGDLPLTFTAKSEFNKVLEINGGKIKEWGIKVSDKVTF